jgi:hypothetical protein
MVSFYRSAFASDMETAVEEIKGDRYETWAFTLFRNFASKYI